MAVNPVQYLLVPRVIAGLVMVPLLAMVFDTRRRSRRFTSSR